MHMQCLGNQTECENVHNTPNRCAFQCFQVHKCVYSVYTRSNTSYNQWIQWVRWTPARGASQNRLQKDSIQARQVTLSRIKLQMEPNL